MAHDERYAGRAEVRGHASAEYGVFDEREDEQGIHVVPMFGAPHNLRWACWCHPEMDQGLIVHNVAH